MLNEYNSIICSCCDRRVAGTAYTCPFCGQDVGVMKSQGSYCGNCEYYTTCDREYGPVGYPCLAWRENID